MAAYKVEVIRRGIITVNDIDSPEEREQINFVVDLIGEMIEAKKDKSHFENLMER